MGLCRYDFGGFGDVAFIGPPLPLPLGVPRKLTTVSPGWLPLDLYRSAGDKMRPRKEVLRDWPDPIQPEPEVALGRPEWGEMFGQEREEGRLVIQW